MSDLIELVADVRNEITLKTLLIEPQQALHIRPPVVQVFCAIFQDIARHVD